MRLRVNLDRQSQAFPPRLLREVDVSELAEPQADGPVQPGVETPGAPPFAADVTGPFRSFPSSIGSEYARRVGQRTREVYAFCAASKGRIFLAQGKGRQPVPLAHTPQECVLGSRGASPAGCAC